MSDNESKLPLIYSKDFNKIIKADHRSILIEIKNLECYVDCNPDVFTEYDVIQINKIVDGMSKNIFIDKTYVVFKGNRWKDAFIIEEKWEELIDILIEFKTMKKYNKYYPSYKKFINSAFFTFTIVYLSGILDKYGYDPEELNIKFNQECDYSFEVKPDFRTNWNY